MCVGGGGYGCVAFGKWWTHACTLYESVCCHYEVQSSDIYFLPCYIGSASCASHQEHVAVERDVHNVTVDPLPDSKSLLRVSVPTADHQWTNIT